MRNISSITKAILYFVFLILIGVIGYSFLLQVDLIDAIYMTIITISTVGYKEVAEMSSAAKLFSIFIILGGLTLVGYTLTNFVEFLAGGHFKNAWRNRKMDKRIEMLKDHYIVCGAGETGQNVAAQLKLSNAPFIVIDERIEKTEELKANGCSVITGEPTHEAILKQAGIERAKGLVAALSTDSENIFVVLTARYLNKDLFIVSRAIEPHACEKLMMAGANRTVSPNEIGGRRMAAMMTKPSIFSFLDIMTRAGDELLNLEEITIEVGSELDGLRLKEARIPEKTGLIVLSLKKAAKGNMIFNPSSVEVLKSGDTMIVIGNPDKISTLVKFASAAK